MLNNVAMIDDRVWNIDYLKEAIEEALGRTRPLRVTALSVMENQVIEKYGIDVSLWPDDKTIVDFLVRHYKGR